MTFADLAGPKGGSVTVSVIMANYNGSAYLAEAIDSVRRQSLAELELIVSDDNSSDDSVAIVSGLIEKDQRIRLITVTENRGPAAARNRAIAVARGDWLAIMDSDDVMHPARLATLIAAARQDGADIVADDSLEFHLDTAHPTGRILSGRWAKMPTWIDVNDYVRMNNFFGSGSGLGYLKPIIRADLLRNPPVPPYDETLTIAEDYHLILRLLYSGRKLRVLPTPYYYYRRHRNSISYRLNKQALQAVEVADLHFTKQVAPGDRRLNEALGARARSLATAIAFVDLLSALKCKDWSSAVSIALARPQAFLLLRLPVLARCRRMLPTALVEFFSRPHIRHEMRHI
jgi:glycosyltransferase involved in cell wall biosynthesis